MGDSPMNMKRNSAMAVGVILAVLFGNALAGIEVIGYHADCIDGIDNDNKPMIDGLDNECAEYPYSDGNGENPTPPQERYQDSNYKSLFEYHRDFMPFMSQPQIDTVCALIQIQPGGYEEPDLQNAIDWTTENQVNCQMAGP